MRILFRSALLALCCASTAMAQSVSITGGVPAVEDFSIMAGTQDTTGTALPTGWVFLESGSGANTSYLIDDGTSGSGNTFSYGAAGSADRAIGALGSGSVVTTIGARLQNDTGGSLSELLLTYTGEQWRSGTPGAPDTLNFQYCVSTCALSDASNAANWTDFNDLDLVAPITNGTEGAKLDGNQPANRIAKSATITGLSLAAGAQLWIRWFDINDGSVDDALAIDDFSVGLAVDNPPQLASSVPANGANNVPVTTTITLNFSEAVTTTGSWYVLECDAAIPPSSVTGTGNTRTITPEFNLPFDKLCTITLIPAEIRDTDGSLDTLTGATGFSFTTVADVAPSVVSTVPADTATGIIVNANLTATFSEAVTPTLPNWLTLICAGSGAHTVAISGGPTIWTINPDSDFGFSELCTATIAAANVEDQDGMPDPMTAPKTWTFTTGADLAPTVSSTTPADGAINVALASDITVVFSEPVNTSASAFSVSCVTSGSHTVTTGASPASTFVLNPDPVFAANESCTVTVTATLVADIDGTTTAMVDDYVFDFETGTDPDDDYAGVDASSCTALRATLHDKIDDHTGFPYSTTGTTITDTWDILVLADQNPLNSTEILEVYENAHYPKAVAGNANFNKEHTWPNSYGFNNLDGYTGSVPQSSAFSDTHMLYLSDITYNSNRGSKPYADCPDTDGCTPDATLNYNGVGGGPVIYASGNHNWKKTSASGEAYGSYEVWNHRKGDMARAVLYMDIRYEGGTATGGNTVGQSEPDLVVTDDRNLIDSSRSTASGTAYMGLKSTLLAWHVADPPDEQERLRNNVIFSFQRNRNPFIDHPEWVECLFSCNCTVAPPDDIFDDSFETSAP